MKIIRRHLNTLRNQMLFGSLLVMTLILGGVAIVTFKSVSTLLKINAEKNIQQTAVQANGRLEAILEQIDTLTTEAATSTYVQQVLQEEANGATISISEQQKIPPEINIVQLYGSGVEAVYLYSYQGRSLYPFYGERLQNAVRADWINEAMQKKGSLVWFGNDRQHPDSIVAIRLIKLIDQNFMPGGFLLVRINRSAFSFPPDDPNKMLLVGVDGNEIATNIPDIGHSTVAYLLHSSQKTIRLNNQTYMIVRQHSSITRWTLFILTPISEITDGISMLRSAILIPAGAGFILFIFLSLLLSTIITKPILKLIRTMRTSSRNGVLQEVAAESSTVELHELQSTYNEMVENINNLIRLVYEKEILQSRTELKALQAQINPHFLFNTLEAFYRLLVEKEQPELAEYVITMSGLFRYTISRNNKEEWVSLGEELEHAEKYLSIMKMRLGDRLSWDIEYPFGLASCKIPKLIIQPIVENAIVHGVENRIGPGKVFISASVSESGDLLIRVQDDGAGMDAETLARIKRAGGSGDVVSSKRTGMGISNVRRRLQLYYGKKHFASGVSITSRKGEGTTVQLKIPLE
ncbi:MAG TPA: sensor histidine kinase [Bacilli bacterium]